MAILTPLSIRRILKRKSPGQQAVSLQQVQENRRADLAENRAQRDGSPRLPTRLFEGIGEGLVEGHGLALGAGFGKGVIAEAAACGGYGAPGIAFIQLAGARPAMLVQGLRSAPQTRSTGNSVRITCSRFEFSEEGNGFGRPPVGTQFQANRNA
jgi:hypothetical protein